MIPATQISGSEIVSLGLLINKLDTVQSVAPDLINRVRYQAYCSQDITGYDRINPIRTAGTVAEDIMRDFRFEFRKAREMWKITSPIELLPGGKIGFMGRFIRLERKDYIS